MSHCTLTILPTGQQLTATMGDSLLQTLLCHGIFLRSDCGGKGSCGKCRVEIAEIEGVFTAKPACTTTLTGDLSLRIPASSLLSAHVMTKAPASLPPFFSEAAISTPALTGPGIAVDLGTTTIAIYLCELGTRRVLASLAVKNPQALYGADVMSRISAIGNDPAQLSRLQQLTVQAIEWGIHQLFAGSTFSLDLLQRMVVVGNPAMIHILLGVNPSPLGTAPYHPVFREGRQTRATDLGFAFSGLTVHTLNHVAGFIGGDTLAATLACQLAEAPIGTLLVDLGTNGELVLKAEQGLFATSCATGPAFEGAALSCGMQATPGAIDRVTLANRTGKPGYTILWPELAAEGQALGLCGSGVISAVAALLRAGIIEPSGRFVHEPAIPRLVEVSAGWRYLIAATGKADPTEDIYLSQKDIRAVQLGKAALITGIEFLLRAAGMSQPNRIIIAGAFGSFLDPSDMLAIGMIPAIALNRIEVAGNSAGVGAIMALCDPTSINRARQLAEMITMVELTTSLDFQRIFVERLRFPDPLA